MIPSVLATQFREGLTDYMETTFPVTSPIFEGSIRRFLEKEDAFFHEPFVSVKLPFRVAEHGNERFDAIHSEYAPYVHQNKAFDRLNGDDPRSTLVATGTGSGKTECFLYPVLEYCYQHRGEPGIKALIIYPDECPGHGPGAAHRKADFFLARASWQCERWNVCGRAEQAG